MKKRVTSQKQPKIIFQLKKLGVGVYPHYRKEAATDATQKHSAVVSTAVAGCNTAMAALLHAIDNSG